MAIDWDIEDVLAEHPDLYLNHCAAMAVALMDRISRSSCKFDVSCRGFAVAVPELDKSFEAHIGWSPKLLLESRKMRRTEQSGPMIERASIALTALLLGKLVANSQMRVTKQGERADYWLPRIECALEISGTGNVREVVRRRREKRKQVLANPLGWDGFVSICCFDPARCSMDLTYHAQPEPEEFDDEE